jgi:DNA polymerase I-like protein with 3'-5' exonuclease and polymerase domains
LSGCERGGKHEESAAGLVVDDDEIVVECDAGQAEAVGAWVTKAMVDAMTPLISPVPVEVEVKVGRTWAGD